MAIPEAVSGPGTVPYVELKTERLLVRPWQEQDIPEVLRCCQDPEIQRWTTVPTPYRVCDAEKFVREITLNGRRLGTDAIFGVFLRETGQIAGAAGVHGITANSPQGPGMTRHGEIGYWAAPDTRCRGYLTEAVREIARWSFEELGLHRLVWQAYDGNAGSRRVAEKAGFRIFGMQRASHVVRGEIIDMWLGDMIPGDLH